MKLLFFCLLFFVSLQSNTQPNGLKIGDQAPLFKSVAHNKEVIDLKKELKKGPVVLFFYRGSWCPYCNKQMSELQDSIRLLTKRGAIVIGVTPETEESMEKIIVKSRATFPIIHDDNYKIMNSYDVGYKVDNDMVDKLESYNVDLGVVNGNKDYVLPVPATYIIGKNGKIKYVYFNTDYTHRVSVAALLTHL